jgi:hypothetical protein
MPDKARNIPCPDCGYDLTGLIESWSVSPPEHATCSECGRSMETASVLVPERREPRWSFEHGADGRLRRFACTWMRLLCPTVFWSSLPSRVRLRPIRLATFVLIAVLACYAWIGSLAARNTYWAINTPSPWRMMGSNATPPSLGVRARMIAEAALWPEGNIQVFWSLLRGWGALALGGSLLIPIAFLPLLPLFLRIPGGTVALVRATLYQLPFAALLWTLLSWKDWSAPSLSPFCIGSGGWPTEWICTTWSWTSALIVGVYTLWVAAYWWGFVKKHARVPRPALVWAFVMFTSFGTMILLVLRSECVLPRIEIGMFLVDLFGQPLPSP